MADETSKLGIDVSSGIKSLQDLIAQFRNLNKELVNVRIASATLNKENIITAATISATTKAGAQLYANFKDLGKGLETTKTSVVGYTGALNEAKTAKERLAVAAKAGIPDDLFAKRNRSEPTPPERQKFDTAVSGLTNLAALNPDALGAKQIENIFALVRAGSKQTYSGVLEDARQAVVKIIAAHEQLGESARKARFNLDRIANSNTAVGRVADLIGPIRADASGREIEKFNRKLVDMRTEMRNNELGLSHFNQALNAIQKGSGPHPEDSIEKLRQKIVDAIQAGEGLGASADRRAVKTKAAADKEVAAEAIVQAALLARQKLEQSLSEGKTEKLPSLDTIKIAPTLKPTVDETLTLSKALDKLQNKLESNDKQLTNFAVAFKAVESGSSSAISSLTKDQKTIAALIKATQEAYNALGSSARASAEQQSTQNARAINAFTIRGKVEKTIPIDFNASKGELDKLTKSLDKLQNDFEKSGVEVKDFDRIIAAINSGTVKELDLEFRRLAGSIIAAQTAGSNLGRQDQVQAKKDTTRSAKIEAGQTVRTTLLTEFSIKGVDASTSAIEKYNKAVATAQIASQASKRTIDDFNVALASAKGSDVGTLSNAQAANRSAIISVKNAQEELLAAQKKTAESDKAAAEEKLATEKRIIGALQAKKDLETSLVLPAVKIDSKELIPFESELQKLRRELEQDVNGLHDFEKAKAAIGGFKPPGGGAPPTIPPLPDDFSKGPEKYFNLLSKILQIHSQLGTSAQKAAAQQKTAIDEATAALQRQKDAASARTTLDIQFPLKAGTTLNELRPLHTLLNTLQSDVERGKVSIGSFNAAIEAFRAGKPFGDLGTDINKAVNTIVGMELAWQKMGSTAQARLDAIAKDTKKTSDETKRLQDGINAVARLNKEGFTIKADASSGEVQTFLKLMGQVQAIIERGKVSFSDFERVVASLTTDNIDGFSSKLLTLRDIIIKVGKASSDMGSEIAANDKKAAGAAAGQRVENLTRGFFDIPSLKGTPAELNKVEEELAKIQKLFKDGTKGVNDYDAAIAALQNKSSVSSLTPAQKELLKVILQIEAAADKAGTTEARATDKATAALDKQIAAANKLLNANLKANNDAVIKQQRQSVASTASTTAFQAFGPIPAKATGDQIETFKTKIASAIAFVEKGKVSLDDFKAALNRVLSGVAFDPSKINTPIGQMESRLQGAQNTFKSFGAASDSINVQVQNGWNRTNQLFKTLVIGDIIGRLLRSFEQITAKAAEFAVSIGLLLTLSQNAPSTFNDWSDAIRSVSDQLGKPATDVATAAYDALSNQVIESADDFAKFGVQVGKLAIITRSDLKSSVDAVSGVLNSFNLSINDTSRVSSILFKSIDLGKITMTQLADTMGRLGPIVSQLGIGIEEFNAFLTSTSRAGISVDVAMTQVGQVLNALLKPNEELQKFFEGLGVSGGEAAISVFGFTGVLQKLADATGGSSEALAKFFPELRGLRGVVSVLRNDFKEFTGDLEKLRNESGKSAAEAARIFNANPGQHFREELEKIRNFFLTQWETVVLKTLLSTTDDVGGLTKVVQGLYGALFTISVPVLTFAAIVAGAFKVSALLSFITGIHSASNAMSALTGVTRVAGITFSGAFGPVVFIVAAISAALVTLAIDSELAKSRMSEFARAAREAGDARASATTAEFQQGLDQQVELTKQAVTQQAQAYAQLPAKIRAILNDVITAQKEKAKELADSLKESLDLFAGSAKDRLNELKQIGRDIQKGIDTGPKQTEAFNRDVGRGQFDRAAADIEAHIGDEPKKAKALLDLTIQRIQKQTEEQHKAEEELKTTTDIQGVQDKINETFKERLRLLESLSSITQKDAQVRGNRPNAALQASRQLDVQDTELRRQSIGASSDQRQNIRRQLNTNQLIKEFLPKASDISLLLGAQKAFLGGEQRIIELAQERAKTEQRISEILTKRAEETNRQIEEAKRQNEELATSIKNLNAFSLRDTQGSIKKEFKDDPTLASKKLEELIAKFQEASKNVVDLAGFNNSLTIVRNLRENLAAAQKDAAAVGKNLGQELETHNQADKASELSKGFVKLGEDANKAKDEIAKANKNAEETFNKTKESLIASAETIRGNFSRATEGGLAPFIDALLSIAGKELPAQEAAKNLANILNNFSSERIGEARKALEDLRTAMTVGGVQKPLGAIIDPKAGISPKVDANKAISDLLNNFDPKNLVKTNQELDSFDQKIKDIKKQDTTNILQTQIKFAGTEIQATLEQRLEGAKIIAKEAIEKIQQERDKTLKALEAQVRIKTITPEEGAQKTKEANDAALQQADDVLNKLKKKFADLRAAPEFKNITNDVVGQTTEQVLNRMEQQLNTLQAAGQKFQETRNQLSQSTVNTQQAFGAEFEQAKTKIDAAERSIEEFGVGSIQALGIVKQAVEELIATYDRLNASINAPHLVGPPAPKPVSAQAMGGVIRGFASGGFISDFFSGKFARGIDNIPIMATRGETIINPIASRKFYTQLQAINQNRQPLFNQRTNNTTTNIGDVNVNVTGSTTPSKTARQIGLELKREIRRGNLR